MFNQPSYKKTIHGFHTIEDVFSLRERWLMKKQLCPLVRDLGESYPGLQSYANMHEIVQSNRLYNFYDKLFKLFSSFNILKNGQVSRSWIKCQEKDTRLSFHTHPNSTITCIYYLTNPEKLGTTIELNGNVFNLNAKENSILILPSYINHTSPKVNKKRYSVIIDF